MNVGSPRASSFCRWIWYGDEALSWMLSPVGRVSGHWKPTVIPRSVNKNTHMKLVGVSMICLTYILKVF